MNLPALRYAIVCIFLCIGTEASLADTKLSARFFPAKPVQPPLNMNLPQYEVSRAPDVSPAEHNNGVRCNNNGVEAMNAGKIEQAIRDFIDAVNHDPNEIGFLSNLLVALRKEGKRFQKAQEIAHRIMALAPDDYKAPYTMATIYLENLKQPLKALPYFAESLRRQPGNPNVAIAMASAYEKAGYADEAIFLLRENAHKVQGDPYPMYLLGTLLAGEKDYPSAIRALNSALSYDSDGFVHDAYIRARFYAGQLEGLHDICVNALARFPQIINRESLERILYALQPGTFELIETVTVKIIDPSAVKKLDFLVRPLPNIPNHQQVILTDSEILSGRDIVPIKPAPPDTEGRIRFTVPMETVTADFSLRMRFHIQTEPFLGSRGNFDSMPEPNLKVLAADKKLSLDNPELKMLASKLDTLQGNFVQNTFSAIGEGLGYRENFEDNSVAWALANPDHCDCTEFSRLLAALCINKGIPARMVTGFLVKKELIGNETSIGHAWCEIYFPGKGWFPADPTLGKTMNWAYFGNLLSDQILFDKPNHDTKSRISVDFTSTRPDMNLNITSKYLISVIQ